MLKLRILILSLLLCVFSNSYAKAAEVSIFTDDSCTAGTTALSRVVANITTLGLFTAYSANFYMSGADGSSDYSTNSTSNCNANVYPNDFSSGSNPGILHNSKSCDEGDTNCTSSSSSTACNPKGGVKICYKYIDVDLTEKWDCNWANTDGWGPKFYILPVANIRVMQNIDRLCAYFNTPLGYQAIGCKYMPDCTNFGVSDNCFVADSCTDNGYKGSHSILPISATVIQCVKESIARIFIDTSACGDTNQTVSYFPSFQHAMRKAVRAALALYLILFGIKMALGHDMPSKGEFFKMGAKYILVLYFSVGISTGYGVNNQPIYDDGITTYMIPFFTNGSSSLTTMIYTAGGATGLCAYDADTYEPEYAYLSMWDSIDCRILYYFGFDLSQLAGKITAGVNDTDDTVNNVSSAVIKPIPGVNDITNRLITIDDKAYAYVAANTTDTFSSTTDAANDAADTTTNVANDAADTTTNVANDVADTTTDVANDVADTTTDVANDVADTTTDVANDVADTTTDVANDVADTTTDIANAAVVPLEELGSAVLLGLLIPSFFSFQIIFLGFSTIFSVLLLSIVVYIVNITIISMTLVSVLIYLAPLFVPMALFEQTKHYYDSWLKLLIAYALQPMIVAAYIAMMFTIFDQVIFGDCNFAKASIVIKYSGYTKEVPIYMLCDPGNPGPGCVPPTNIEGVTPCEETIGYYITPIKAGYSYTDTVIALFFNIVTISASTVGNMMTGMFTLCLFGYLFYKFAGLLSEFAMDLTGGTNIGNLAGDPMAIANKAMEAVKSLVKAKMTGNPESGAKVSSGDGKE